MWFYFFGDSRLSVCVLQASYIFKEINFQFDFAKLKEQSKLVSILFLLRAIKIEIASPTACDQD